MDLACACDGLSPLPVEEKAIMESDKTELFMDVATLAMTFPPCLSRKGLSLELDKHEIFMDWAYVCDGLFPLPVEGKPSWSWENTCCSWSCKALQGPHDHAGQR